MFDNTIFKRQFSMSMYKNKQLLLNKMTFSKDFVKDTRGDLYPVLNRSKNCLEDIIHNTYVVSDGYCERFLGSFFPFATYEICFKGENAGFGFYIADTHVKITCNNESVSVISDGENKQIPLEKAYDKPCMIISCRPGAFDIYFKVNDCAEFFATFECDKISDSNNFKKFSDGYVSVICENATAEYVKSYIDCGISQADMRPIRYENGDVMLCDGKIYLTMSVRMQKHMFQGVFSWIPTTAEFELTGAVFFDAGDDRWCGDVASSVLFNRKTNTWYLWVASFNHGHVLAHAEFDGDIRFGVNVVDITLMQSKENSDTCDFSAKAHDEDPDFYYDENKNKWYMAICRKDPSINSYRYFFFESDKPFEGYTYIGQGNDGAETGGSFITVNNEKVFMCGNDFKATSDYRIYTKNKMHNAKFNFRDGGFRGWGTLIPVKLGSRTRYFLLTFDRHNGSDFNWSYGNIYCFEITF